MVDFEVLRYGGEHLVGYIPSFLHTLDPRPAKEQFNDRYAFGGGWTSRYTDQGKWKFDPDKLSIKYPGDPTYHAVARIRLRDETILIFPHAWVMIVQADGTHELARMD